MTRYLLDPRGTRRSLLVVAAEMTREGRGLPLALELAVGDARLRTGQPREARAAFARVRDAGTPELARFAALGAGVAALSAGDLTGGLAELLAFEDADDDLARGAIRLRALAQAALGRHDEASRTLAELAAGVASTGLGTADVLIASSVALARADGSWTGEELAADLWRASDSCRDGRVRGAAAGADAARPRARRLRPDVLLRALLRAYRRAAPIDVIVRPEAWLEEEACAAGRTVLGLERPRDAQHARAAGGVAVVPAAARVAGLPADGAAATVGAMPSRRVASDRTVGWSGCLLLALLAVAAAGGSGMLARRRYAAATRRAARCA